MHLPRLAQRPHLSNPTAGRRAAAAATACALAVTVSLAAAAVKASSSDAAQATGAIPAELASSAAQGSAPAQEVRLITGDVIRLNSAGGVAGVEPGPRTDATRPRFLTYTRSDQTYVFPSDVQSLIGRQLDPELFNVTELASYGLGRDGAVPVIVQAGSGAGAATVAELAKLGLKVTAELGVVPAQAGQADAATDSGPAASWLLIEAAAEPEPGVEKIWLDGMTHVEPLEGADGGPDPGYQTPPWMEFIGADQAKAGGLSGAGVKVAVVDSGVDSNHPDLAGQVVAAKDFTDLGSPIDENGHGTFVASEIAGTGAASDGVYAGVAPGAKIVNARVLDADGWGSNSGIL
ncbi:MAG: S8 family serine peptidase, partial [Bifidobacteriaceae bacterium]|nr:S8 family serine peptidase [Bifidobacteriaceae bacterium]